MQPLSGTFWLSHGDESTIAIPFDADELLVKQALEALEDTMDTTTSSRFFLNWATFSNSQSTIHS
eukprot:scaffold60893_cov59-Cyclotella_meneghiniana.AAC.3